MVSQSLGRLEGSHCKPNHEVASYGPDTRDDLLRWGCSGNDEGGCSWEGSWSKVCVVVRHPSQLILPRLSPHHRRFAGPLEGGLKAFERFHELSGSEYNPTVRLQMCCRPSAGICTGQ